jgi:hypothetical protein
MYKRNIISAADGERDFSGDGIWQQNGTMGVKITGGKHTGDW